MRPVVFVVSVSAALVVGASCPSAPERLACNQDRECFIGQHCADGFCEEVVGEGEGEGAVGEGEGAVGEGEGEGEGEGAAEGEGEGEGEGAVGEGEGEGAVGEGEGEGEGEGAPCVFVVDDGFDGMSVAQPLTLNTNASATAQVGGGVVTVDLAAVTDSAVSVQMSHASTDAALRVRFHGIAPAAETQVFIRVTGVNGEVDFLVFEDGTAAARVARPGNPYDDLVVPVDINARDEFGLGLLISPGNTATSRVQFVALDPGGEVVVRDVDVPIDFSHAFAAAEVQAYAVPPIDPPPVEIDRFTFSVPSTCSP